jgi:hypothetical protein
MSPLEPDVVTAPTEGAAEPFRDRSTGLVAGGVLVILLGIGSALLVPVMILGLAMARARGDAVAGALSLRAILPLVGGFAGAAALFVSLGIGSIQCRRWARALLLAVSWIWLAGGITRLAGYLIVAPRILAGMGRQQRVAGHLETWMEAFMGAVGVFMYAALPAGLVLFYGRRDVRATCEARDPRPGWTDRCPQAVLPLVLVLGLAGVWSLLSIPFGPSVPVFGLVMTGLAGGLTLAVLGLAYGSLAWGAYALRRWAWWGALAVAILWNASAFETSLASLSPSTLWKVRETLASPPGQSQLDWVQDLWYSPSLWVLGLSFAIVIAYLLFVLRHFDSAPAREAR